MSAPFGTSFIYLFFPLKRESVKYIARGAARPRAPKEKGRPPPAPFVFFIIRYSPMREHAARYNRPPGLAGVVGRKEPARSLSRRSGIEAPSRHLESRCYGLFGRSRANRRQRRSRNAPPRGPPASTSHHRPYPHVSIAVQCSQGKTCSFSETRYIGTYTFLLDLSKRCTRSFANVL